jgi:exodeoxyribonuclease-3
MTTIISWNVNGIRAVEKKGFVSQLLSLKADIVCIQETKAKPEQLSAELLQPGSDSVSGGPVYHSYFSPPSVPVIQVLRCMPCMSRMKYLLWA